MENIYNIAKFAHVLGFAFMSIPLFNLIVVNERALMGPSFNYETDRYFENIIKRGAVRCYVFQFTVFISGLIIVILGPGLHAMITNWVLATKTVILFSLMGLSFGLIACTEEERDRVLRYEKGTYLGKADQQLSQDQLRQLMLRSNGQRT